MVAERVKKGCRKRGCDGRGKRIGGYCLSPQETREEAVLKFFVFSVCKIIQTYVVNVPPVIALDIMRGKDKKVQAALSTCEVQC